MSLWRSERGAAAVEFALVVPVLLALMLGIIEFGRAYNTEISLTHAAREAARDMAIHNVWTDAVDAGRDAAPSLDSNAMVFIPDVDGCGGNAVYELTIQYPLDTLTGVAGDMVLESKAAMRCGG